MNQHVDIDINWLAGEWTNDPASFSWDKLRRLEKHSRPLATERRHRARSAWPHAIKKGEAPKRSALKAAPRLTPYAATSMNSGRAVNRAR